MYKDYTVLYVHGRRMAVAAAAACFPSQPFWDSGTLMTTTTTYSPNFIPLCAKRSKRSCD